MKVLWFHIGRMKVAVNRAISFFEDVMPEDDFIGVAEFGVGGEIVVILPAFLRRHQPGQNGGAVDDLLIDFLRTKTDLGERGHIVEARREYPMA